MPGEIHWYVVRGEEQAGPFTDAQLRVHAEKGDLKPDDQVWRPGFDAWRRAGDVPGLLRPPTIAKRDAPSPAAAQQRSHSSPPHPVKAISQAEEVLPDPKLIMVRGWLLLLSFGLTFVAPFVIIVRALPSQDALNPWLPTVAGLGSFFVIQNIINLVLAPISILAGLMLWSRRPDAHVLTRGVLLYGLGLACALPFSIYLFVGLPPDAGWTFIKAEIPQAIAILGFALAGYFYLERSRRVHAIFGPSSAANRNVPDMPLRIAAILALVTVGCEVFLVLIVGPQYSPDLVGHKYAVPAMIGRETGRWLMIFLIGALGAGIGHLVTRRAHGDARYVGPITGGVLMALAITALTWLGESGRQLVETRTKGAKLHEARTKSPQPVDAPAPARKEPIHLMMVVLDATPGRPCALYLAPTPESTCLLAIRKYQEVGAHTLTVNPIETRGEPLTGRALEIHCVTPAGTMIGTHVRKRADEIQCSK